MVWVTRRNFLAKAMVESSNKNWIDAIRSLPSESAGKQVWMEILKGRYPDAAAAARAHGLEAAAWDELSNHVDWPTPDGTTALADTQTFLARIAEQWYRVHVEAIRRYDSNHLIFGDKILGGMSIPDFLMPILKQ